MNFDFTMRSIQRAVRDAGGDWIGIQETFHVAEPYALPKIVFRHPYTKKAILYAFDPVTVNPDKMYEDVLALLKDNNPPPEPEPLPVVEPWVPVKVATLLKLAETLSDAPKELNALCEQEKKK